MKKNLWITVLGILVAAGFVLLLILFTVRQGDAVVVTTFGRPHRSLTDPGLYVRWPWPIQQVHRFDNRTQCLDGAFEQTLTRDGKSVIVGLYAGWRIAEPIRFLERVGGPLEAERNLDGLLSNTKNAIIGRQLFSNLVNVDPEKMRFDEIERDILAAVRTEAHERYGMDVRFVGIRKITLPEAVTEKVFERMRAEREQIAERYRSEGEGESIRIRAEADSERAQLLAEAEAEAERLRARGDAEAAEFYKVFEQQPQLAMFLRKLDMLEKTMKDRTTVVLGPDTQPFDLLSGDAVLPIHVNRPAGEGEAQAK